MKCSLSACFFNNFLVKKSWQQSLQVKQVKFLAKAHRNFSSFVAFSRFSSVKYNFFVWQFSWSKISLSISVSFTWFVDVAKEPIWFAILTELYTRTLSCTVEKDLINLCNCHKFIGTHHKKNSYKHDAQANRRNSLKILYLNYCLDQKFLRSFKAFFCWIHCNTSAGVYSDLIEWQNFWGSFRIQTIEVPCNANFCNNCQVDKTGS